MNRFRPQAGAARYQIQYRRQTGHRDSWNWQPRGAVYVPRGRPWVYRIGAQLHYLADHAPVPVQRRWKKVFEQFCKRYRKF